MILVTLGTQDKLFIRLIKEVENLVIKEIIKEEVLVQTGDTDYQSPYLKTCKYLSDAEYNKYIKECSFIITHGGVGTITKALEMHKKVIAVARLKKYKEHINDHQLQIISSFKEKGYLLDGTYDLEKCVKEIPNFEPKTYESNTKNFVNYLETWLKENP